MSEYVPPTIAPQVDSSGNVPEPVVEAPEPAPITEQEVGEYREQDRFLPVSAHLWSFLRSYVLKCSLRKDCQCITHHEVGCTVYSKNLEGGERMRTRMCLRVHKLHNIRSG